MDNWTYGLAQRSALSNGNLITLLNTESWRDMRSQVLVSLLVTGVLGDEVKVFSADNESSVHLGGNDGAGQDTATDGDETSERALLVYGREVSTVLSIVRANCIKSPSLRISSIQSTPARRLVAVAQEYNECTYQCSDLQSPSLVFGSPVQRPCTIFVHPFQRGTSPSTWSSRRCAVASGTRAPIAR